MIEAIDLWKIYDGRMAVQALSFLVRPGEILGFVGANGAGKTSTLRMLAGILPPTAGAVRIGGVDLAQDPIQAKRRLGFVPDTPQLFDDLTVIEHLGLASRIHGLKSPDRALALLSALEIADRAHDFPDALSRGMRQKVALAWALVHEPPALILDEPLTGLDPKGIRTVKNLLHDTAQRGTAIIISSHSLDLIDELSSSLLMIDRGQSLALGSKDELLRQAGENASLEDLFFRLTEGPKA